MPRLPACRQRNLNRCLTLGSQQSNRGSWSRGRAGLVNHPIGANQVPDVGRRMLEAWRLLFAK
jgi:hypothetical protein